MKTLVWIYCYYVFEHNPDIQSYIFNSEMIRASKVGGQVLEDMQISKSSFEVAMTKILQNLMKLGLVAPKSMHEEKQPFFVIKKDLFRGIEKTF